MRTRDLSLLSFEVALDQTPAAFFDATFAAKINGLWEVDCNEDRLSCVMKRTDLAFTRVELLFCLLGSVLVVIPAVSLLASNKSESQRAVCYNNLRQIGRAFQSWTSDHENALPFRIPYPEGTKNTPNSSFMNSAWFHYSIISNHLASPKVLGCPADQHAPLSANNWGVGPSGFLNSAFRANALSYSIFLDSFPLEPRSILSSDRNIRATAYNVSCSSGATQCAGLGLADPLVRWTNDVHGVSGDLLFCDGSAAFTSSDELRSAVQQSPGDPTELHILTPR